MGKILVATTIALWGELLCNSDDEMPDERQYPLVLMVFRWDGTISFVTSVADDDFALDATQDDFANEVNILLKQTELQEVHRGKLQDGTPTVLYHAMRYDKDENIIAATGAVMAYYAMADRTPQDGTPFWAHLADYGNDDGWHRLISLSNLAPGVRDQLIALRKWMYSEPRVPKNAHP